MKRPGVVLAMCGLAVALLLGFLKLWLGRDGPPADAVHRAEQNADAIIDSASGWRRAVADSQPVLDSIARALERGRAELAAMAGQLADVRARKATAKHELDSLTTALTALADSNLPTTATASDSAAWWHRFALRQGQALAKAGEVVTACEQADSLFLRRDATAADLLKNCEHRGRILGGQLRVAHARLDRAVGALDTLRQGQAGCSYIVLTAPCPELVGVGGVDRRGLYGGGGVEWGSGHRVAVRSAIVGGADRLELRLEGIVRLRRLRFNHPPLSLPR